MTTPGDCRDEDLDLDVGDLGPVPLTDPDEEQRLLEEKWIKAKEAGF